MSKKNEAGKPAIFANYEADPVQAFDPRGYEIDDASWIPGYSEIVRANEIAAADDHVWNTQHYETGITKKQMYQVIGADPRPLPVVFRWLRVVGINGGNSPNADRDRRPFTDRGYRPVRKEDLEQWGIGFPPTAHVDASGMIRRDDVALFVVDGRREKSFRDWERQQIAEAEATSQRAGKDTGVAITSEAERGQEMISHRPFKLNATE